MCVIIENLERRTVRSENLKGCTVSFFRRDFGMRFPNFGRPIAIAKPRRLGLGFGVLDAESSWY